MIYVFTASASSQGRGSRRYGATTTRQGATLNHIWNGGLVVQKPPRKAGESPVDYYKRTRCVDDNYTRKHNGFYYCNPAHCHGRWKNKKERDEHLDMAYSLLG